MTVKLSAELLRSMGFRPFEKGESITASFSGIYVYQARGITLQADTTEVTSGTIAGVNYRIAVGAGLNDTCMALVNDVYTESEDDWRNGKGCSGAAFVLIHLGPTPPYTVTTGHLTTERDGSTTTFDSFPNLRENVAALEAAALPQLVTALSWLLGNPDRQIEIRKIDHAIIGRTETGRTVRDIRVQFAGNASISHGFPATQLVAGLQAAATLAPQVNAKAARFFALGLDEDDELKKFLFFFLALEIHTHAVFRRIDHAAALQKLLGPASRPRPSAVALLQRQADQFRNLFDRFVWCAECEWSTIDDADVEQFKKLKDARDKIAHGSESEPPAGYAKLAQQLAKKVLRS